MIKRKQMTEVQKFDRRFAILRFVTAILIALIVTFIIIHFTSDNALTAIANLFKGPLTTTRRFSNVLEMAIPLTFAGLAVSMMFRANQFNMATEGAFFLGALAGAMAVILIPGPAFIKIILALLLGSLVGALVCYIPGKLRVKWGASELVVSLMLNYVCLYLGTFIMNSTIKDNKSAYYASLPFPKGVSLGRLIPKTRLHGGIFIVIICVILAYILMYKTTWGYKLRAVGSNTNFAKHVGIDVSKVIISSQLLGGFIAGLGGSTEMIGMYTRFQWSSLPGYGFDGIVLHTLARGNPALIPLAAFAISYLRVGADYMYKQSNVASEIVAIIEALIIVLVGAWAFLSNYRNKKIAELATSEVEVGQ